MPTEESTACSIWRPGHSFGAAAVFMLDCCFLAESANIKDLADEAEGVKTLCSS